MRTWRGAVMLLCGAVLLAAPGCGKKASEDKPMTEVRAEAEKMSVEQLRASAKDYLDAIKAQQGKLAEVQEKLRQLKVTELMSDKAQAIKTDAGRCAQSVRALQDRLSVYVEQLKSKGQDVRDLK